MKHLGLFLSIGALAVVAALATPASAAHEDCRIVAQGPFFYAGLIIPATSIECDSVKRRIKISAELTRDGVVAARATRTCRNRDVCHLGVDAHAEDQPGNQRWCVRAWGSVGKHSVGEARSCENESF